VRESGWNCKPTTLTHPDVKVKHHTDRKKSSRKITAVSSMRPSVKLVVPLNNMNNGYRALIERQFYVKDRVVGFVEPDPVPLHVFDWQLWYQLMRLRSRVFIPIMTYQQFIDAASGRKRRTYANAVDSLKRRPITRSDSHISFFVKCENTNLTAKPDAVPRAICPRGPRYCVELGRYIKAIERTIYKSIDEMWGEVVVMKGRNAVERAKVLREKWDSFSDPVAIGCDATRFDQHVSVGALEWEHLVYRSYFPHDRKLAELLRWQLRNKIYGNFCDGSFKASLRGHRMSGDPNTALGNTLLMSSMLHAFLFGLRFRSTIVNDGDDSVIFLERKNAQYIYENIEPWFRRLGFRMEVEALVDEFEAVEFCQAHPVWNGMCWTMVRNHYVARAKDLTTYKVYTEGEFWSWLGAVGQGGMSMSGGIPVFQEFYQCLIRSSAGWAIKHAIDEWSGLGYLSRGLSTSYTEVTDAARVSYYIAYGVPPDVQRHIEEYYRNMNIVYTKGVYPELDDFSHPNDLAYRLLAGERIPWA